MQERETVIGSRKPQEGVNVGGEMPTEDALGEENEGIGSPQGAQDRDNSWEL